MDNTIEIKCVMDSEFCKGNTWYQIRSMSDHVVYVYLDKYEFVGLPKCHFDMEHIKITVKGNDMQEKITLKVGDEISMVGDSTHRIIDFKKGKIVLLEDGTNYGVFSEKYYVNGKLYARENIIVPDFKEKKVEYQEITNDNIMEVLEFNKSLGLEVDNIRIGDNCICFNFNGYKQEFEFDDDGGTKWLQHTEIETGKLKPLPKANPFDVVKVGDWVKSKKTLYHYQCQLPYRTKDKWYQRVELNNKKCFVCNSNGSGYSSSDSPCDWDLTDIRDYNPTECELKVGDVIDFGSFGNLPIDEFNYIDECIETNLGGSLICRGFKNLQNNYNKKSQLINGRKYDKITIPPFDFVKCLMDAGFTTKGTLRIVNADLYLFLNALRVYVNLNKPDYFHYQGNQWKTTPANAQILIEMAKLSEGLK